MMHSTSLTLVTRKFNLRMNYPEKKIKKDSRSIIGKLKVASGFFFKIPQHSSLFISTFLPFKKKITQKYDSQLKML